MTQTAQFPTAAIVIDTGTITVPCEPINEWLAITPVLSKDEHGRDRLAGTFTITHLPTGTTLGDGDACIECCRACARKFTSLKTADWSALTTDNAADWYAGISEDDRNTFNLYRSLAWGCDAEYCDIPAPAADADLPTASPTA